MKSAAKPSVAIIYGFAEGPLLGGRLRRELAARGFRCTRDVRLADCIIAHSGGTLLIPDDAKARTVLLIAPTAAWRGTMLAAMRQKVRLDQQHARHSKQRGSWIAKTLVNMIYIATSVPRAYRMLRRLDRHTLPQLTAQNVGVVTFRNDPWSERIGPAGLHRKHAYAFISYDRTHDDLWLHPADYVSVLQYLYAS